MPLETPLTVMHLSLGAKMVPFAGYTMPISYPPGIIAEHLHTRAHAGLFDVSHMGQVTVSGQDVAEQLERLIPANLLSLSPGCSTYALLTNEDGGVRDDLIATHLDGDRFFLVINAGNKHADVAYFKASLPDLTFEMPEARALMALQGPAARLVMQRLSDVSSTLTFMTGAADCIAGIEAWVTCSGYTGEDGFEISVKNSDVRSLVNILLQNEDVEMIGLGARDSLRLEAGLCLYGQDIDENISPIEAGLIWSIQKSRRLPNMQYKGVKRIIADIQNVNSKRLVGIRPEGKVPARAGTEIQDAEGNQIGLVTSGGYSPTLGCPIAMGYVNGKFKKVGTPINLVIRNKSMPASVVKVPFVSTKYYRG